MDGVRSTIPGRAHRGDAASGDPVTAGPASGDPVTAGPDSVVRPFRDTGRAAQPNWPGW
jgi:hypothetical protein